MILNKNTNTKILLITSIIFIFTVIVITTYISFSIWVWNTYNNIPYDEVPEWAKWFMGI